MVRIVDEGSHFDAPISKVWKLIESHATETSKIHPGAKNAKIHPVGENQGSVTFESDVNGQMMPMKFRVTAIPPTAQVLEILQGPLAGSKVVNYYTAKGDKTAVTVIADFESPMLPPHQLEAVAREFLQNGFDEDQAYLKTMH
ncbi:MAG: hypothetical protein L3K04_03665 [Thermoplasmata archaeon]|nr:hypothetical protein [Thermoplasmata archaeon]MCI4337685.1 hypothetical protein [Thermoplasmata archaeon]MCI4341323.1 hypothetical protein [Thermoplasmata archaeon]